jgi:hypothetical protein
MTSQPSLIEGDLGFLQPSKTGSEIFSLPSGEQVSIQKYFLHFNKWNGVSLSFDFGRKPIIDFNGEACFAELAILRMFQQNGWEGTWVETYGGKHYLNSMPNGWKLSSDNAVPADKEELISRIQKIGNTLACFDVVAWRGDKALFIEAKRLKKDRLTNAQKRFIQGAIRCGVPISDFLILEWDFGHPQ